MKHMNKNTAKKIIEVKKVTQLIALMLIILSVALTGCAKKVEEKGPITVGSMIDSEGTILGNMLIALMEQAGYTVTDKLALGTPDILRKALEAGEVDLVIDYTGSGQYYGAVADEATWSDAQLGYEATKAFDKTTNNIEWLAPSKANNTEMFAVKQEFAQANGLKTVADLANYINGGGTVKLICSASFAENTLGLLGYQEAYGFTLSSEQLIILSHGNTAEMLKALNEGTNEVNVSLVYGTDGSLPNMSMVVLEDPESVPPVYLPAPVLRGEMAEKYPELRTLFADVFATLDLVTLQTLNARVTFDGEDAKAVAIDYLEKNGFLK
jgi:osmoprotectant transport system substrate-binding protein